MGTTAFGQRLRKFRQARGLTLQQVADDVGCTKAYIWELEMREGPRPTAERLNAIAKVLHVTLPDLMGESPEGVPQASPDDVVFFRNYVGRTEAQKRQIKEMANLLFAVQDTAKDQDQ
ncbi:helix-turn-helix domain-containing protein [Castellaniella hirudinis]|uniref:helix-turn-helix domain-containing protein n=1 Tax=Castellaniella hirudinis TaxID=1144617 RepID=UPI0039C10AD2